MVRLSMVPPSVLTVLVPGVLLTLLWIHEAVCLLLVALSLLAVGPAVAVRDAVAGPV